MRELTELHGGEVHARDGALFEVLLPLGQAHLGVADVDLHAIGPVEPPASASGPGDVLVLVEDNEQLRAFVAGLLGARWTVVQARVGREGLAMARALRTDPALADIPLIFLSAKTQPEDRVKGLELAQDYLCKPFGASELLARVENLLRGGQEAPRAVARPQHEQAFLDALERGVGEQLDDAGFGVTELARRLALSTQHGERGRGRGRTEPHLLHPRVPGVGRAPAGTRGRQRLNPDARTVFPDARYCPRRAREQALTG